MVELIQNENRYNERFARVIGSLREAIRTISRNFSFSGLYEIGALSSILQCKVRSIYPRIDYRPELDVINNTFDLSQDNPSLLTIYIFWTSTDDEIEARRKNAGKWSANHFVPLLFPTNNSKCLTELSVRETHFLVSLLFLIMVTRGY